MDRVGKDTIRAILAGRDQKKLCRLFGVFEKDANFEAALQDHVIEVGH
jgi:hypothetical protein